MKRCDKGRRGRGGLTARYPNPSDVIAALDDATSRRIASRLVTRLERMQRRVMLGALGSHVPPRVSVAEWRRRLVVSKRRRRESSAWLWAARRLAGPYVPILHSWCS